MDKINVLCGSRTVGGFGTKYLSRSDTGSGFWFSSLSATEVAGRELIGDETLFLEKVVLPVDNVVEVV
jgi:hypothetical protein